MKLDYQIQHVYNNYMDSGCAKYDYIKSTIWVRTQNLCKLLKDKFKISVDPGVYADITYEIAIDIWRFLQKDYSLIGTYGDDFLNNW